jgi:hypothetical protein
VSELTIPNNDETSDEWATAVGCAHLVGELRSRAPDGELVDARLVQFAGRRYGFFVSDHPIPTATHVLDRLGSETSELKSKNVGDLEPGDMVVIVEGSDSDVLRERADKRLPLGSRDSARTWSRALLRAQGRFGSERGLCVALVKGGCSVTEQTVRGWLRSTSQIGPMSDADLDVIAAVTADSELINNLEACRTAIGAVRAEHLRASQDLAREVIRHLRAALSGGAHLDDAIRLDDRAMLLTVDRVEARPSRVPVTAINRVRSYS